MRIKGQRKILDDRYRNLQKREFIADNMKFVKALLLLSDNELQMAKDPHNVKFLTEALDLLSSMTQDRDSPMRYLLMGYCDLQKLERLASGFKFSEELFQEAQHNLTLALDLAQDNMRIRASALMNLGLLHRRVHNPGLSARFFSLRKKLPFVDDQDRARFSWLYAQALYQNRQVSLAAAELGELPLALKGPPWQEREAFYLSQSGKYVEAAKIYQQLLESGQVVGDLSLAKVDLSYGYTLFKLKREVEARAVLQKSLGFAKICRTSQVVLNANWSFNPRV